MTYSINQPNSKNLSKSNLYGLLGSALSCVSLFLIMWFYIMPYTLPQPVEEEGLMVSFGDNENAGGMGSSAEPLAAPEAEILAPVVEQKATTTKPISATKEDLITSTDNANVISEKIQKDKDRKQKEQDLNQKNLLDQKRIAAENRIAQQKRKEQDAINKAGATVNGLFSNGSMNSGSGNGRGSGNGTGNGSGNGSESGIQGRPFGHGNLGGNNATVNGRHVIGGKPAEPVDFYQEGKVVVYIKVNSEGKVVYAKCTSGGNISDNRTKQMVETAAYATKFTTGNNEATGTIVYNLRFSSN